MKSRQTKQEIRQQIAQQVEDFLRTDGEIHQVKMGDSGLVDGKYNQAHVGFGEPKQTRTPLDNVVAELEQRKRQKKAPAPKTSTSNRRKKKVIYDDFGEPLRWVWDDGQ